jgi:hypothetical protein
MCSLYYIKDMIYDRLFVCVIRGKWRLKPASTYHSVTCRTGKNTGENRGS